MATVARVGGFHDSVLHPVGHRDLLDEVLLCLHHFILDPYAQTSSRFLAASSFSRNA